jgi:hypothetical protein
MITPLHRSHIPFARLTARSQLDVGDYGAGISALDPQFMLVEVATGALPMAMRMPPDADGASGAQTCTQ